MGIDYTFGLGFGFMVSDIELARAFGVPTPEVSHCEPRFDPKTGARVEDETVIDQRAGISLAYNGQPVEDTQELLEALSADLSCSYSWFGENAEDAIIGPDMELDDDGMETGRITCSGGMTLAAFIALQPEVERIGAELKRLGVQVGEAWVGTCWSMM